MWSRETKNTPWSVEPNKDAEVPEKQRDCYWHDWKPILLLNHTVYNCSKCDIHKEKWEREQKERNEKNISTPPPFYF